MERSARDRWWRSVLLVTVLGALLRIGYVVVVTQHHDFHGPDREATVQSYDERWYQQVAISLADGDGFRYVDLDGIEKETARHPPAAAIALVPAALLSDDDLPMRLTVAIAGTAVVLLTAVLARRVAGDLAGLVAAVLAALHPYLWLNDGLVMAETFASLATVVVVLATVGTVRRPTVWRALGLGIGIGVAALSRGELLLLGPALALVLVVSARSVDLRRRLLLCAGAAVGSVAVLSPWALYNLDRFEERVLLSTNDGDALIGANCDETYRGDLIGFHYGYCGILGPSSGDESIDAAVRREVALEYMRDEAARVPLVAAARVGRVAGVFQPFWMSRVAQDEGRPLGLSIAGWWVSMALLPAVVTGSIVLRRRALLAPVLAPVLVVLLSAALTHGQLRFRAPAEPALVVLAAAGIAMWLRRRRVPDEVPEAVPEPSGYA